MRYLRLIVVALFIPSLATAVTEIDHATATSAAPTVTPEPASIQLQINIPARELHVFEHGALQQTYAVAIGQLKYRSVVMNDVINRIEWNPWWYPPDSEWAATSEITPPGPKNPLGPVKIPLGRGIRIHGTNNERSVGQPASHGCFRMHNKDAIALAWLLQSHFSEKTDPALLKYYAAHRTKTVVVSLFTDVPISIVYETIEVHDHTLYLYPDIYGQGGKWEPHLREVLRSAGYNDAELTPEQIAMWRAQLKKGKVAVALP